jgi:hypothetical protein
VRGSSSSTTGQRVSAIAASRAIAKSSSTPSTPKLRTCSTSGAWLPEPLTASSSCVWVPRPSATPAAIVEMNGLVMSCATSATHCRLPVARLRAAELTTYPSSSIACMTRW